MARQPPPDSNQASYFHDSRRPLTILVFLLPLIAVYEFGSVLLLHGVEHPLQSPTIRAHYLLDQAVRIFGVGGVYLPGLLVIAALLTWHIAARHDWKLRPMTLLAMAAESIAWTLPLLVLAVIATDMLALADQTSPPAAAIIQSAQTPESWRVLLLIAIGAGVYEELLFRLLGVSAAYWVLRTAGALSRPIAATIAIILMSAAFALYHDLAMTANAINFPFAAYYALLGLAFGALYLWRGFGIVVAAHALLDVVLLLWW